MQHDRSSSTARDDVIAGEWPALFGLAWALCGDREEAQDLVQETIARAIPRWDTIQGPARPYLRRILVNLQADQHRRSDRADRGEALRETVVLEDPSEAVRVRVDLEADLRQLDAFQRQVVVLRYFADLSFREIARLTGRPGGTVRRVCGEAVARMTESERKRSTTKEF